MVEGEGLSSSPFFPSYLFAAQPHLSRAAVLPLHPNLFDHLRMCYDVVLLWSIWQQPRVWQQLSEFVGA